ncbi:MAG TPA: hypothetical protein RMH85_15550 [Polyangiaceae bacterium LLY-WYZ-15_(1-7)]|nr:hypothetical protein [Sandaracinus sp.]HJK93369.1 hypothetical protein [Polyangiaceae bacterium LLY-WYZ-15_(1-7)]HJL06431.1 hypothetical protein [Polyangiaceae bacterium LLY-WYZ-15_(1-7)]HJL09915.1 hypothetical protein [Polyangiaceae bacterium LLY-WYZ-15_(1-7)]HJL24430.1 hypothetical protein [Polyangiaceae bacterium LLY-WYZ-15_(1-7)]
MMMIRRSIAMLAIVGLAWGCDDGDDCPEPIVGEDAGGIDASVPEPDGGMGEVDAGGGDTDGGTGMNTIPDPSTAELPDPSGFDYSTAHTFTVNDILGDFAGTRVADDSSIVCTDCEEYERSPSGVPMYPIDSEFGFIVRDFVGLEQKTRDGEHTEGWVGTIMDEGAAIGLAIADVETDIWRVGFPRGTWCAGLGGTSIKCSAEQFVAMEHVQTCNETIPYYYMDPVTGEPVSEDWSACEALSTELTPSFDTVAAAEHDLSEMAVGLDYSMSRKDDGKPLYRWGSHIKSPNDVRLAAQLPLPAEWSTGEYRVTRAQLAIVHTVTNNPNDQVRPEDHENEFATGRLPGYEVLEDGRWVSTRDCYEGDGDFIPAGTTFRNPAFAIPDAYSEDLREGFTNAWYSTMDRDPFAMDPVSGIGPRWRLTANKFGQVLPGLEIPSIDCAEPPVQMGGARYETGDLIVTVLNLLDWPEGENPLELSSGWTARVDQELNPEAEGEVTVNGLPLTQNFDLSIYIKGDRKPTYLFSAVLYLDYEPVE